MRISCHAGSVANSKVSGQGGLFRQSMDVALSLAFIEPMGKPKARPPAPIAEPPSRSPNFIRPWRKHRNMTQEQLAEAIDKSAGYISQLETGKKRWNEDLLEDIADVLRTTVAALLTRPPPKPGEPDPYAAWEEMTDEERLRMLTIYKAAVGASRR